MDDSICLREQTPIERDHVAANTIARELQLDQSVEFVIGLMADGWSEADILGNYPGLLTMTLRAIYCGEGIPERSLKCVFSPMRIFLARPSPLLKELGTTSFGSG
jgi:hypothetical protein